MNHEIKAWEEHQMIVMDIHLDNFMAFKNFHMNMSYPKKNSKLIYRRGIFRKSFQF